MISVPLPFYTLTQPGGFPTHFAQIFPVYKLCHNCFTSYFTIIINITMQPAKVKQVNNVQVF